MAIGDEKHKLIYQELVNILGADYVADDPAIMEAFRRSFTTPFHPTRPEFIVLPGSTEDVQQIIRLANRYQFPYSVTSTGLFLASCCAVKPYWCFIDPKRLNKIEIDEKNMYAIVQPYVTIAQLQAEIMKLGLFYPMPGASAQASVLANSTFHSGHWTSYRTGHGNHVLGVEWVLPTGEVLRTGSLAIPGAGFCWGEGPGPDARGILRSHYGHLGTLGITTRLAVKLFHWPGPSVWPTEGVQPEKKSILPEEKFKYYFITYPTLEKSIEAIREIGKSEIGEVVMKFTPWDCVCWASNSFEEFWNNWHSEYWDNQIRNGGHIVWVGLWATASEKQLEYEDKVLQEIIHDTGGELIPEEIHQWLNSYLTPDSIRDTHRLRFLRIGASIAVTGVTYDSVGGVQKQLQRVLEIKNKYSPPLGNTGNSIKFWPGSFSRTAFTEFDLLDEKTEEAEGVMQRRSGDIMKQCMEGSHIDQVAVLNVGKVGPAFHNVHKFLAQIKKGLDPNNLANPTRLVDIEAMEETKASN